MQWKHPAIISQNPVLFLYRVGAALLSIMDLEEIQKHY